MADAEANASASPPPEQPQKKVKRVIRKKRRPARVQIEASAAKDLQAAPQAGTTYNIYYNKWEGGDRGDVVPTGPAQTRCSLARDSGYTKADSQAGSFLCIHFARGMCHRGPDCDYLHRSPTIHDSSPPHTDNFGREKFNDYRDDMGGVGSFQRQNRTIYVGRIFVSDDIEEVVSRHFAEWGEIERIRVLTGRGVAFVTYKNEAMAQFAKEAMSNQSLDHEETLNVRWATQDPNPMAQKREARRIEEQAAEAIRRALPADFVAQIEGKDPEAKKRKVQSKFALEGYEEPDEVKYAAGLQRQVEAPPQQPLLAGPEHEEAQTLPVNQGGIFSSNTLAALGAARASVAPKEQPSATPKALVAYDSDSE